MNIKCKKHPKYKGIRPPNCQCKECVLVYVYTQGLDEILSEATILSNILFNYKQCVGKQLTEQDAELMSQHQTRFDHAVTKFNQNLSK